MTNFEKVVQFNQRVNALKANAGLDATDRNAQYALIVEEYRELKEAFDSGYSDELVKELIDLLYVAYGLGFVLGIDLDKAFNLVHENNMNKMAEGARFRADGKLLKPDGFVKVTREEILNAAYGKEYNGDTTND